MPHRLTTNCAKNYCNRTIIVKDIVENVVTCFFWDTVYIAYMTFKYILWSTLIRSWGAVFPKTCAEGAVGLGYVPPHTMLNVNQGKPLERVMVRVWGKVPAKITLICLLAEPPFLKQFKNRNYHWYATELYTLQNFFDHKLNGEMPHGHIPLYPCRFCVCSNVHNA